MQEWVRKLHAHSSGSLAFHAAYRDTARIGGLGYAFVEEVGLDSGPTATWDGGEFPVVGVNLVS